MSDQIVVSSKYVPKWAHVIVTCHELAGKEHAQDSSFRKFQPVLTEALHESPAFVLEIKSAQNPSHHGTSQTFSLNLKVAMISVTVGTYQFSSNRSSRDHWWCIYLEAWNLKPSPQANGSQLQHFIPVGPFAVALMFFAQPYLLLFARSQKKHRSPQPGANSSVEHRLFQHFLHFFALQSDFSVTTPMLVQQLS